jgi:tetratricopeptide (TPR) repeat protein/transglutaminase-like putative cysteine protease
VTRFCAILLCLLSLPPEISAQNHRPAAAATAHAVPRAASPLKQAAALDSKEPFIIEQYATTARFENDGTGERVLAVRVRVQSDAGAQQLRQLAFNFNSGNEQIDVRYVRVRKPDGAIVNAAADDVKEIIAPIVRDLSAYAGYKEKQITVPALAVGDELEYEIATRTVTPFAPGEFWFAHYFVRSAIVRDERLEISVPETRKVILKSAAGVPYETRQADGRTIYLWKHANLSLASDDSAKNQPNAPGAKPADVELTTFAGWDAVARWYVKISQGRDDPIPEIRAKTDELTHGETETLAKVQTLYDYVSTSIRYRELQLGQGGWAPHTAGEVLSNKYGDSQDKNVLLAAMLKAAGISSDAVLIPYTRKLDASVPSPAQFDHVITIVPLVTGPIWMDTTTEVAPFQLLASPLRGKSALLVPANGVGRIVETPADPPFVSTQHVDIDGRVSDLGKLTARAHYAMRGDTELVLRLAFHRTPQAQWKELGQTILSLDGIHGEVTAVKPADPLAAHDPFVLDIEFAQPNFLDWSAARETTPVPLLAIGLPDPPANAAKPVELGSPLSVIVKLKLDFPPDLAAQPPVASSVARDYAEFKSSYRFEDHSLSAERSLDFKMRTLSASRTDDYRDFSRAVTADQNRALVITRTAHGTPAVPSSATADDLVEAGLALLNAGNAGAAIPLFSRAVELDPHHQQAWNDLGLANLRAGKLDEAAAAFRKQLEINPADEHANDYLGLALERQNKDAEAAAAFRKQIAINPLDVAAHAALGEILLAQHEYSQAAPELDKATILAPENPELQISLGRALLNTGNEQKALAAFEKAAALSPTPLVWNDIAFNLAESKLDLDKAQQYAELAVRATVAALGKIDLEHVTPGQLRQVTSIAASWDTLGWVHFQKGDSDIAERYVRAAWLLDQNGEMGDHLAQVYEKRGEKDRAVETYALALAAPHSIPETRARLTLLLGGNSQIDDLMKQATPKLVSLRTISAGKLLDENVSADFFVVLSPGEKSAHVDSVRFISGSEKLRPLADRLRSLDYGAMFPDASAAKLIRRGTLTCSAKDSGCVLVLNRAEDARAAE